MNVLRFRPRRLASGRPATCSAEITVPWMTSRSTPVGQHVRGQLGGVLRRQPHGHPHAGCRAARRPAGAAAPATTGRA